MVHEIILNLDGSKATPIGVILADMLECAVDIHLPFITKIIIFSFGCFPNEPVFQKNDDLDKENFSSFKVSRLLTGFRKNYSTQTWLMSMLEMWKNTLNKGGYNSAIFMDLS